MKVSRSKSLFNDKVVEIRNAECELLGMVEELGPGRFKATNYLKIVSHCKDYQGAEYFILASFNQKPASQVKIDGNQTQLFT